jgi:HK97 gp10 family phage protein
MARSSGFRFESNRHNVDRALSDAEKSALIAIGEYVIGEAKLRSPVGEYPEGSGRVGGRLRDSIDYKVDESQGSVVVGTNVEYAPYVEKGTSKMDAQPYLTPAVEENKSNIKSIAQSHFDIG